LLASALTGRRLACRAAFGRARCHWSDRPSRLRPGRGGPAGAAPLGHPPQPRKGLWSRHWAAATTRGP